MRRIAFIFTVLLLAGCSSIDCPLNAVEGCIYQLGREDAVLADTLTVHTILNNGKDSIIFNRFSGGDKFTLPMSYDKPFDQLFFVFSDTLNVTRTDTVKVHKTDIAHFESVDCSPVFFHQIGEVEWTRHVIDSIVISKSIINYDTTGCHLQLYLKPGH